MSFHGVPSAREISGQPQPAQVEDEEVHDFWKPMDGLLRRVTSVLPTSPKDDNNHHHVHVHNKLNDLHARIDMLEGSLQQQQEAVGMVSLQSVDPSVIGSPSADLVINTTGPDRTPSNPTLNGDVPTARSLGGGALERSATHVKSNFVFPPAGSQMAGSATAPFAMEEVQTVNKTFDRIFNIQDVEATQGSSEKESPSKDRTDPVSRACAQLWGGPTAPNEQDTILSWLANFFGGVTTAHGINRVFDDHNGHLRRIFWLFLFFFSFVALVITLESTFADFLNGEIATNINFESASNVLPMMTFCNVSPLRCGCEAFYEPELVNNDEYLRKIVPYVCNEVVAYLDSVDFEVDSSNKRIGFETLEEVEKNIDYARTRAKMLAFTKKLTCDNGDYTKAWFVSAVKSGTMSNFELLNYAGYHDRGRLIRFCKHTDPDTGSKESCMSDNYWGNPYFTDAYGACHTLNPCHGFPVGEDCEEDADCGHEFEDSDDLKTKRLTGGKCTNGKCECTLCKAGADCKVMKQLKPGKNEGVRVIGNVGLDQDSAIASARRAIFNPGLLVHLHSKMDEGGFGSAVTAGPGRVTELVVAQHKESKEAAFPFTNCSFKSITAPETCEQNCLARVQAIKCCGMEIQQMEDGRFPTLQISDPSGDMIPISSPTLGCNALNPELNECMDIYTRAASEGTICLDAARYEKIRWYYVKGIQFYRNRIGWYDAEGDRDDDDISDQEEDMWEIKKHCVWHAADRELPEDIGYFNGEEPNYGRDCTEKGDEVCKSATGKEEDQGECVEAFRAYCPGPCKSLRFDITGQSNVRLSDTAARIIAAEELGWVTWQSIHNPSTGARRWQPRCPRDANGDYVDSDTCFTSAEAEALVKDNYAVVNVDYEHFQAEVLTQDQAMPITDLLGVFGGNLGMWVGMSIMTICEWFELGIFALLAMPFFYFGIKMPYIRRVEPEPVGAAVLEDETVGKVTRPRVEGMRGRKLACDVKDTGIGKMLHRVSHKYRVLKGSEEQSSRSRARFQLQGFKSTQQVLQNMKEIATERKDGSIVQPPSPAYAVDKEKGGSKASDPPEGNGSPLNAKQPNGHKANGNGPMPDEDEAHSA